MMFHRIVVGLDGSEAAWHALEQAIELAALCHGRVQVVSVEEHLPAYAATVGEADEEARFKGEYFRRLHARAKELGQSKAIDLEAVILPGHAADVLTRAAREFGGDLLVVGHTGHSKLHHLFLGSTADRVVERAHCPVLVVR